MKYAWCSAGLMIITVGVVPCECVTTLSNSSSVAGAGLQIANLDTLSSDSRRRRQHSRRRTKKSKWKGGSHKSWTSKAAPNVTQDMLRMSVPEVSPSAKGSSNMTIVRNGDTLKNSLDPPSHGSPPANMEMHEHRAADAFLGDASLTRSKSKALEDPGSSIFANDTSVIIAMSKYGDTKCRCTGFNGLPGVINVTLSTGVVSAPSSYGSTCDKWNGDSDRWCFVDPCNCDMPTPPKQSTWYPGSTFRGESLYYSEATCGYMDSADKTVEFDPPSSCSQDDASYGKAGCKCVGFAGRVGNISAMIESSKISFSASIGSSCAAWDDGVHPSCTGQGGPDIPVWCSMHWCYVDPCACDVDNVKATYFPSVTYQGKSLRYSYAACGEEVVSNVTLLDTANCVWPPIEEAVGSWNLLAKLAMVVCVAFGVYFGVKFAETVFPFEGQ